jgi:hypothetical protein
MKKLLGLLVLVLPWSAYANITVYGECNYRGPGVTLQVGEYDAAKLRANRIPEDVIKSVKVTEGYVVTVYADDNFSGKYGTLRSNDACLDGDGFGNVISSLSVRESLGLGAIEPATTPTPSLLDKQSMVTVYTDCNHQGLSASFEAGEYLLSQIKKSGIGDNEISAVKVPEGMTLTVYENDFLRGNYGTAKGDIACLDDGDFGGKISSLAVAGKGTSAPAVVAAPTVAKPEPSANAAEKVKVGVYAGCNYRGNAIGLDVGEYTATDLKRLGMDDNTVSSVKVAKGYQVELFENDFFRGRSGTLRSEDDCLRNDNFDDTVSSLIVSRDKRATMPTFGNNTEGRKANDVVSVYLHCNYRGGSASLPVGRYNTAAMKAARIGNDTISSIKVSSGYQVTLYEGGKFDTNGVVITANDDCLDDNNLNEKVSSMVVERIGASSNSDAKLSNSNSLSIPAKQQSNDGSQALVDGLTCMQDYVDKNICDAERWTIMNRRCGLKNAKELSDGYLEGHVKAGNCKAEYWNELVRRTANPSLR